MRKIQMVADELFVVALFEADTRQHTIDAVAEVIPFVEDDGEVYAVVVSTIEKLKQMSDPQFRKLDLGSYHQEAEDVESC